MGEEDVGDSDEHAPARRWLAEQWAGKEQNTIVPAQKAGGKPMLVTRTYSPHAPRNRRVAALFLEKHDLTVLATNLRYPGGEADIIAKEPDGTLMAACVGATRRAAGPAVPPVAAGRTRLLATAARRFTAHRGRPAVRLDALTVAGPVEGDRGPAPVPRTGGSPAGPAAELVGLPGGSRFLVTWHRGIDRARN